MMNTPAWRSLTAQGRAVFLELLARYNGSNNGRIALSVREASTLCNIAVNTARRALAELEERGFIECVRRGHFDRKARHATEWRLLTLRCDLTGTPAKKTFARWRPAEEKHDLKIAVDGIKLFGSQD
jgi:hypothetical protein